MTRRIFLDTEWNAPPWLPQCELQWVGLADEAGNSWYGISAEAVIDPETNDFVKNVYRNISPDEPRITRAALAQAVVDFCGDVDEFWVWIPTLGSFAASFRLGDDAAASSLYAQVRDVDLQMLQSLIQPWPAAWPREVHDLNAAAVAAGVEIPPRAANHLHPRVHAEWNRELFANIRARVGT